MVSAFFMNNSGKKAAPFNIDIAPYTKDYFSCIENPPGYRTVKERREDK